jgi:hypothetical protein
MIHVRPSILFVTHATLLLESAKCRPNGRIARRIRNPLHNLADGGFAPLKEEIHDLPLPAAETRELVVVVRHGEFGRGLDESLARPTAAKLAHAGFLAIAAFSGSLIRSPN